MQQIPLMNMLKKFDKTDPNLVIVGEKMHQLMTDLYPICRSITGNGVRQTHEIIRKHIPIETHEVATGTQVFDWVLPKEWNIRDAYIIAPNGEKIVDFKKSNLHVWSYSTPFKGSLPLDELKTHLHSLPDQPDTVPYRTTYYKEDWGFCLTHNQWLTLKDGSYEVMIDSSLEDGALTYSQCYLKGTIDDEVLISCYTCHPSMCNDSLSGVVLTTFLAKYLSEFSLRYSYRFLFIPETIGSITWLCLNEEKTSKIKHGLVATCLGDPGHSTYKKSRQGNAIIDIAAANMLRDSGKKYEIIDFFPIGSDERQFCSPGFNLPIGSLGRTLYNKFREYHTSADDLKFVQPEYLADSFGKYLEILYILENNHTYLNLNPKCEPQLGERGLYSMESEYIHAMFWVLNFSDGEHSLLDISNSSGVEFSIIKRAADLLLKKDLLRSVSE